MWSVNQGVRGEQFMTAAGPYTRRVRVSAGLLEISGFTAYKLAEKDATW